MEVRKETVSVCDGSLVTWCELGGHDGHADVCGVSESHGCGTALGHARDQVKQEEPSDQ